MEKLEGRAPRVRHRGAWQADQTYAALDLVLHRDGVWIARQATSGEPGHDYDAWRWADRRAEP
jgi:hypothetical protein